MELGAKSGGLVFLALLAMIAALEAWWIMRRRGSYPWREAAASFSVALLKRGIDIFTAGVAAGIMFWAYEHRFWTQEINTAIDGLVFFLLFELVYYWHHRWAHEVRWLWATHSVHHSPNHMNLSVASRLGWTSLISGSIFVFVPLALAGYHPITIFLTLAASLTYQVWIHTETIGRLGPLEWIFNTPSHHRVHHASNLQYLDKNYGGVLIIYDRLFGTFAEEAEAPRYGLVTPHHNLNPFRIAFHEWISMAKDIARARTLWDMLCHMFGKPGWRPQRVIEKAIKTSPDEAK